MTEIGHGLGPVTFPTLGWQVVAWMETMLCHGPGDVRGDAWVLDDDKVRFICHAYRLHPRGHVREGRRVYRRAEHWRPKGAAKSEMAGGLVCAEALGPVRFAGWDARGEPVGRPIVSPFIRCLATEEGQSANTYENVVVMLTEGRAVDEYELDVGDTRTIVGGGGRIIPSTASSASKDGGKETFAVADEPHLYVLPELRRMHDTVRRNLGKRKAADPWMLGTSTAFLPGEESVAEQIFDWVRKVGPETALASGVLLDYRHAPTVQDWDDDAELLAAIQAAYGPSGGHMDPQRVLAEIRDPQTTRADAARYWLNQVFKGANAWMDPEAWEAAGRPAETVASGERICLGFDGSRWDDSTALIGCRLSDGHLFVVDMWEKPDGPEGRGWQAPHDDVDDAVNGAFDTYEVVRFYADPPYWQDEVGAWAARWGSEIVHEWWTHRDLQMSHALERLRTAVRAGQVTHDDDPRLTAHIINAQEHRKGRDVSKRLVLIRKDRKGSPRKIDAAVAAALAYEARNDAVAAGELDRGPDVWASST